MKMAKRKSKECEYLQTLVNRLRNVVHAQESMIYWYESDHDLTQYEEGDLPKSLIDVQQDLEQAKFELDSFEKVRKWSVKKEKSPYSLLG